MKKKQKQNSLSRKKKAFLQNSAKATKSVAGAAIPDLGKAFGIYDAVHDTTKAIKSGADLAKAYGRTGKRKINRGLSNARRRLRRLY